MGVYGGSIYVAMGRPTSMTDKDLVDLLGVTCSIRQPGKHVGFSGQTSGILLLFVIGTS